MHGVKKIFKLFTIFLIYFLKYNLKKIIIRRGEKLINLDRRIWKKIEKLNKYIFFWPASLEYSSPLAGIDTFFVIYDGFALQIQKRKKLSQLVYTRLCNTTPSSCTIEICDIQPVLLVVIFLLILLRHIYVLFLLFLQKASVVFIPCSMASFTHTVFPFLSRFNDRRRTILI